MTDILAPPETLLTADEFYEQYAHRDGRYELVEGRVIEMPPAGPSHGRSEVGLAIRVGLFVEQNRLGEVFADTGFILSGDPDFVRGPDLAFVSSERLAQAPPPSKGFWRAAPDLAVEIVSPDDRAQDIADKVDEYLRAGVRMVWVIYPRRHQVYIHRAGERVEIVGPEAALSGGDVLPGFELSAVDLWKIVR